MKKMICALLSLLILSACAQAPAGNAPASDAPASTIASAASEAAAPETVEAPYQMTFYMPLLGSNVIASHAEVKAANIIAEMTNVAIEWIHPPIGQEKETFNIMVASGDFPDAIYYRWTDYPGGATKAIADGFLIPLDPYIDQLANLTALFAEIPEIEKQTKLDDGRIPFMPAAANDLRRRAFDGYLIRQDWLDKLGLQMPETITELHDVLAAFKDQDPNGNGEADEIPLIVDKTANYIRSLASAWGVRDSFQLDPSTKKVAYGPIMPSFKEFLAEMSKWYAEGLIDREFASIDSKMADSKIAGDIGGTIRGNTATFERYMNLMTDSVPGVMWRGIPFPTNGGSPAYAYDENRVRLVWGQGVGVTTGSDNPEAVLRFLDYGYSKEGYDYYGWGVEGESYTKENGEYKLTDIITNDPDKLPTTSAILRYAFGNNGFAKVHNFDFWSATELNNEPSKSANELWFTADNSLLLPLLSLTEEESIEYANIMNEVTTLFDEILFKIVMGVDSVDSYDNFVSIAKQMGIDRAIELQQAAYDRYLAR
ncbi:MAG: extracellular solute-binding protein [Clostridiales bacterium]|jgi:putative aldouronate transport system substrate-binding protein|nr:extracellular solute-binding protein [Clostridiales bacterium]